MGRGLDGGIREQDIIHRLPMGGVGGDGVATHELPEIRWEDASVIQPDADIRLYPL